MKRYLVILALLALLVPGALLAESEITLEGLAEQLAELVSRVEAIESQLSPPSTIDEECLVYLWGGLHRETITAYINAYDAEPGTPYLRSIYFDTSSGQTRLYFQEGDYPTRYVSEIYKGCDFVSHSDWIEE